MHTKNILIIALTLLIACNEKKTDKESVQNVKPIKHIRDSFLLKDIIESFLSNEQVKSDVITIQCSRRNDTLKFLIVDAYPILDENGIRGYTYIKNHKVCVIGDEIPPSFINIEFKEIPVEVRKQNDEFRNLKDIRELKNSEPFKQAVCFKGKNLIECPQFPVH